MSTTEIPTPPPAGTPSTTPPKGLAIAALCVGIAAFLTGLVPVLGLLLGLGAVVLGVLALRAVKAGKGGGKGLGIAGLVLGAVAAVTGLVVLVLALALAGSGDVDTAAPATAPSETAEPETESPSPTASPTSEASEPAETPEPVEDAPAPPEAAAPGLGVPVTTEDGAQYTLTAFTCGIPEVGSEFLSSKAQGEYCQADLTLNNTGKRSVSFNASDVKAYAGDIEYEVDTEASLYADQGNAFLEDVNPGNTLQSKVFSDGESIALP